MRGEGGAGGSSGGGGGQGGGPTTQSARLLAVGRHPLSLVVTLAVHS